ncbi:nitroreductase/quinone reductase family protein [Nocardiopsis protaetiae]|uniref:nitroreductase/quinone reductase family protein n=1 Tax=Nocardiopsis protaetiae TaxID=3382270 RepID=UPI00387B7435
MTHTHPQWYLNLTAHPEAEVQVRDRRLRVRARTARGAERDRLWAMMTERAPVYRTHYEPRTRRTIPVVVLDPITPA